MEDTIAPLNIDNYRDLQRSNDLNRSTVAVYGIGYSKIGGPTAVLGSPFSVLQRSRFEKYAFTFTAPGSYEYFCSLHPQMKATIIVEGAASKK
jgi:Copper binding proteins, plastocyanin/azurin family